MTSKDNHSPYVFRTVHDSKGQPHYQFRMPTARGAWVEVDLPPDSEVQRQLLDSSFLPPWKIEWFRQAYEDFRLKERTRKHVAKSAFNETIKVEIGGGLPVEAWLTDTRPEDRIIDDETVDELLEGLSDLVALRVRLHVLEGLNYNEIAQLENPECAPGHLNTAENSIGRSINRALRKMREKISASCPNSHYREAVSTSASNNE